MSNVPSAFPSRARETINSNGAVVFGGGRCCRRPFELYHIDAISSPVARPVQNVLCFCMREVLCTLWRRA